MGKAIGKGIEVVETFLKELDKPPKAAVKVIKTQGVHDNDVKMSRGGAMPKKTTVMEDIQSLGDPATALADMLAGAARGTTAAATGFYGDMEDLVRKYGKGLPANVIRALLPTREGKETLLPTVEEMNAMLPPVVPKGASRSTQVADVANTLSMANPAAPTAGAAVAKGVKVAAPHVVRGALDFAQSRPVQEAVEQLGTLTGAGPMYAAPKDQALPLKLARANPKTTAELREIAERVGRQMNNEHITSPLSGTNNLAGRSKKESERLQKLNYVLEKDPAIKPPNIYNPKLGDVLMANPGDQTVSDSVLKSIEELGLGDVPIDSPQQGGSRFSLGTIARDPKGKRGWWASGPNPSQSIQDKGVRLLEQLDLPGRVVASHLAMGPISNNYALHQADANLRAAALQGISDESANYFDDLMRRGTKVKGQDMTFLDWPGIRNTQAAYDAMRENPEMRKWFVNRMKIPSITEPLGLPNGLDVQWATTEPDFRNLEVNMTGHTMGELDPYAPLLNEDWHNTYEKRIPLGGRVGRQKVLTPFSLSFPDATQHIMSTQRPQDFTGTIQKVFPHQVVDDQWLNEVNEYARMLKQITGKKEGGEVHMADGGSANFFIDPSAYAQAKSKEMYPKKKSEWTEQDAARHMLAAGMMAQKFGPTAAKVAGLAHEHFNAPVKTLGYALGIGKMPADYEQDLHNNALGIDLAKRAANQAELERLVREATGKSSKTQTPGTPWIGEPKNAARLSDY